MSRTPSMTAEECELELGPRGRVGVRSDNRGLVQKWLTARGVNAATAKALTLATLSKAYNDTSDAAFRALSVQNAPTQQPTQEDTMQARPVTVTVRECGACKAPIGWLRSRRTRKLYPVNVHGAAGLMGRDALANHNDFHRCAFGDHETPSQEDARDSEPAHPAQANCKDCGTQLSSEEEASGGYCHDHKPAPRAMPEASPTPRVVERERIVEKRVEVLPAELANIMEQAGLDLAGLRDLVNSSRPIRHAQFGLLLAVLRSGSQAYLCGPAGSGKTTAAEQAAAELGVPFYFTGAIASEFKLTGYKDANGHYHSTAFRQAYEHGGLFLFDEIDGSLPGAVLAFNAALANGQADFPDCMVRRHERFFCVAAANTFGTGADRVYVGRNQLDGATLDRFAFIEWAYDEELERRLAGNDAWTRRVQSVRAAVGRLKLRHVISPRASIAGAKMLSLGIAQRDVEAMRLWKGLDAETVRKIEGGAR